MDARRFDAWTRRRFGRAAATSLAALVIAATPYDVDARCKKLGSPCSGKRKCCRSLKCDQTVAGGVAGKFCCKPEGETCTATSGDTCCSEVCDTLINGGTCAPCQGRTCSASQPCCGRLDCIGGFCGGCHDRATSCANANDCCFSDCTSNACLSAQGGRCARDVDCRACYLNRNCTNACVNNVCTV
jgi:hypothetical protein